VIFLRPETVTKRLETGRNVFEIERPAVAEVESCIKCCHSMIKHVSNIIHCIWIKSCQRLAKPISGPFFENKSENILFLPVVSQ
jgi:hypothetical protein